MIEICNFGLNFIKFKIEYLEEELYYYPLNLREVDLEKSGVEEIVLNLHYRAFKNNSFISTSFIHRFICEFNEEKSKKFSVEKKMNENKIPTIDCNEIKKYFENEKKFSDTKLFEKKTLEEYLKDINCLGVHLYSDANELTKDTIIYDFSLIKKIFLFILEKKRNRVERLIEYFYVSITETENKKKLGSKSATKLQVESLLKFLKGNANFKLKLQEICESPEKKKSNLGKLSIHSLIEKLRSFIYKLSDEWKDVDIHQFLDVIGKKKIKKFNNKKI